MTENFKISEVDEIFDVHSVKISINAKKPSDKSYPYKKV